MRLTEFSEEFVTESTPQWKHKSKKPSGKKPPGKGNTSPHPARGKMVGEENELAEGIKDDAEAIVQEITAAANKIVGKDKSGRDTFRHFYYPVEYAPPGRTWTRGDGSRYRDPAKLIPGSELRPDYRKQLEQAFGGSLIDYAWKLIQSKGKSIGKVRGEMGSSDYAEAVKVGKTVFIRRSKNTIDVVSPSVFRNMDVWRQKDKSVEEADQPKGGSARSKLNHSLTSRKSGAHADKSKTLPRKAKHKGKATDESIVGGIAGLAVGAGAAAVGGKHLLKKQKKRHDQEKTDFKKKYSKHVNDVNESPLVTRTGNPLLQTVDGMFDDFLKTNPDTEQLKAILRIMGKSMDITGNRAVIDTLKNMGVDESMRGGDLVADIEDKLSFLRYLKQQFARSGDDPETMEEIRRKERDLRGQLRAMTTEDSDPCWKSHKQVGMKKKNGKSVPNCVPK